MNKLKITVSQINPVVGDIRNNYKKIIKIIKKKCETSNIIVFPEMSLIGYPPEDLILKTQFMDDISKYIRKLKQKCNLLSATVIIGVPFLNKRGIGNAALFIDKNKTEIIYKTKLPNYGVFDEKRIFVPGKNFKAIKWRKLKLGILICEDMWSSSVPKALIKDGADIFISINASPYDHNRIKQRYNAAKKVVKISGKPIIYANQVGGQDELVFDGNSFYMNKFGDIENKLISWKEEVKTIEVNLSKFKKNNKKIKNNLISREENTWNALVLGLKDYVYKNSFSKVILGLSGGIDSALSAAIATDALGSDKVLGVLMPSKYSSKSSIVDASQTSKLLNIKTHTIKIVDIHNTFYKKLNLQFKNNLSKLSNENIQSRIRGILLMAYSNNFSYLLISTGNKSEMSVGYSTIYGDMNGGFNVLKDIYKTEVYNLANWRNSLKKHSFKGPLGLAIPNNSIIKEPSAELSLNQKDTDNLPEYEILDKILYNLVEADLSIEEICKLGYKKATVAKISKLLTISEYKRRQAPPGVKISIRSFGKERRYPITNLYNN